MKKLFNFLNFLKNSVPNCLNSIIKSDSDLLVLNIKISKLNFLEFFLKNNSLNQYKALLDIVSTDFLNMKYRFELNYYLLSYYLSYRVMLKVRLTDNIFPTLNSSSDIFKSADWLEREIWDMMGIFFFNHKDLRRILTDYGFEGYPLRKDFPLSGYVEVRYCDEEKIVVVEALEVTQEFRYFNFLSPWEKY